MIETRDQQVLLGERVSAARRLDHVPGEDPEVQRELLPQLVLPLLDEAARGDDQAALHISADDQLLAEQPGHDRLSCTRVVGEEKPERLEWKHPVVYRVNLMW